MKDWIDRVERIASTEPKLVSNHMSRLSVFDQGPEAGAEARLVYKKERLVGDEWQAQAGGDCCPLIIAAILAASKK